MLAGESAIPIPTGNPEGIKVGNELPASIFNPQAGKTATLWKSSASVLRKKLVFIYQGGAWIFLEENFPGKRRNKTGKDRREFQQSFGNQRLGKKKKKIHWKITFFYLELLLLPLAEREK